MEIAGASRVNIQGYVKVRGVLLRLVKTAGVRDTEDLVEKIDVERSREVFTEYDLILFVLNYNEALTDEDIKLFEAVQGLEYIVIVNKTDLEQKLDLEKVQQLAGERPLVTTALIEEEGVNELETAIAATFFSGEIDT